jgi:uncharacterized glyoxalase superfamily protein PhnB
MDFTSSDPYVKVSYDNDATLAQTRTVKKDKNPTFNEWVTLPAPPHGSYLIRFTLWDSDIGADDCMGMAEINLNEQLPGPHELTIRPRPGEKSYKELSKEDDLGVLSIFVEDPESNPSTAAQPQAATYYSDVGETVKSNPHSLPDESSTLLASRPVDLKIISGKNLIKTDIIGQSEPYVKVFYASTGDKGHEVYKTARKEGRDVSWHETVELRPPGGDQTVILQVWDDDKLGKDDFMGQAVVSIAEAGEYTLDLQPRPWNDKDAKLVDKHGSLGQLMVAVHGAHLASQTIGYPQTNPARTASMHSHSSAMTSERQKSFTSKTSSKGGEVPMGVVDFTIVRGLGLCKMDFSKGADPYVTMQFEGQTSIAAKTQVKKNTLKPEWRQPFRIRMPPADMARHLVMKFSVWDDDKLSSDDFMGVAYMPIGAGMDGTHKLQLMPRPGNASDKKLLRKHGSLGSLIVEVKSNLAEDYPPMHSSDYQNLDVEVVEASGLYSATADPYVQLRFGRRPPVAKTVAHTNDPNPIWKEHFKLSVPADETMLLVQVMDHDEGSSDDIIGEGRIRLKGNCAGDHHLVLACPGHDSRQEIGTVHVRIGGERIYKYDDDDYSVDDDDSEILPSRIITRGQSAVTLKRDPAKPVSRSFDLSADDPERTHRMADLWREQLGAERVVIAHPVSSEVKASEESKRQWAYAQHKALEEEAERMRVSHEKRERELEARRANELRIRREEERRKKEDRQRQLEMESFSRVSLRLGGQRRSDEPKEPKEPKASRGRSGYGAGYINYRSARTTPGAGYKSPYAQQPYHPLRSRTKSPSKPKRTRTTTPTAPHTNASGVSIVGGASSPPKPTTADNRSADTAVNLRDLTRLNKPSYCGTDYYFKNGDPRDMGHDKYKSKGAVPFGKLSKGRPFTYESPLDAKLGDPVHYSPADTR